MSSNMNEVNIILQELIQQIDEQFGHAQFLKNSNKNEESYSEFMVLFKNFANKSQKIEKLVGERLSINLLSNHLFQLSQEKIFLDEKITEFLKKQNSSISDFKAIRGIYQQVANQYQQVIISLRENHYLNLLEELNLWNETFYASSLQFDELYQRFIDGHSILKLKENFQKQYEKNGQHFKSMLIGCLAISLTVSAIALSISFPPAGILGIGTLMAGISADISAIGFIVKGMKDLIGGKDAFSNLPILQSNGVELAENFSSRVDIQEFSNIISFLNENMNLVQGSAKTNVKSVNKEIELSKQLQEAAILQENINSNIEKFLQTKDKTLNLSIQFDELDKKLSEVDELLSTFGIDEVNNYELDIDTINGINTEVKQLQADNTLIRTDYDAYCKQSEKAKQTALEKNINTYYEQKLKNKHHVLLGMSATILGIIGLGIAITTALAFPPIGVPALTTCVIGCLLQSGATGISVLELRHLFQKNRNLSHQLHQLSNAKLTMDQQKDPTNKPSHPESSKQLPQRTR